MNRIVIDFDPSCAYKYVDRYNIVTVDVLRATSTIIIAMEMGADKVIVCSKIEDALKIKNNDKQILVGERQAVIVEGFDYTNSPFDLSKVNLKEKEVILTTSTGTRLIINCQSAANVLIGSTLNSQAVAKKMLEIGGDWVIIGSGSHGEFRDEDKVGCALIANELLKLDQYKYSCSEETMAFIQTYSRNIQNYIENSTSSTKLRKLGRNCDIDFVINQINNYKIVPLLKKSGLFRLNHINRRWVCCGTQ